MWQRNKLKRVTAGFDQCSHLIFRLLLTSNFTSARKIFSDVEILSIHFSKEKTSLSFMLVLPHIRAHTCKTALISLKSKHTWYNHNQGLLPTSLNLTRSCCSHTLIILSLYCVKNSPMQPSWTGGIYHRNLVWVYMGAHSMEHGAGVCFSFAVHSLDLICDKLPKWPPDCSL